MHGDAGSNDADLLNSLFDTTGFEDFAQFDSSISRQEDAAGTTFADDPLTIEPNNGTYGLDSFDNHLPAHALDIYGHANATAVAAMGLGRGQVIYLGWDWYDALPVGSQNDGWFKVLKSAISETNHKIVGTNKADVITGNQTVKGEALTSGVDDSIFGGKGGDDIDGQGGADRIFGGPGEDFLRGGSDKKDGFDRLYGGPGDDYLQDAFGGGRLWGQGGADQFAFGSQNHNPVFIMDFKSGVDQLFFDTNNFTTMPNGILAASAFHKGSLATMDEDDRVAYLANGKVVFDEDGSGDIAGVLIATLSGHPVLKASDILFDNFG